MDLEKLKALAHSELAKHRLAGWKFAFTDTKRRLGACKYRIKQIEIAAYYARNSPDHSVIDTLLHEIAHALAGPKAGHGPVWKAVAVRLGATPRACDSSQETVIEPGDWQTTCAGCGKTHHRYRRPPALTGYRCHCPARSPLTFEYKGDPALQPEVPVTRAEATGWKAVCQSCRTLFHKSRRPKAGSIYHCRCGSRNALVWKYVQAE